MGSFKNKKIRLILEIAFFSLLALIIGSSQTVSPFLGNLNLLDEGQFAAWANFMLHGQHMFKDMYIVYGPMFVYPLYLLFKYISPTAFMIRVYFSLGTILGIVIINIVMRELKLKLFSRLIMNALLILLPLINLRQSLGFIALYFSLLSLKSSKIFISFLCGTTVALTLLTSPEIGILLGLMIFLYFLLNFKLLVFKKVLLAIAGLLLPLLLFAIWSNNEGWFFAYITNTVNVLKDFRGINVPNGQGLPDIFILIPRDLKILLWLKLFFSKDIFIYYTMLLNIFLLLFLLIKKIIIKFRKEDSFVGLLLLYSLSFQFLFIGRPDFPHFIFGLSPLFLVLIFYLDKSISSLKSKNLNRNNILLYLSVILLISVYSLRILYINNPQIKNIVKIPQAIAAQKDNPKAVGPILISKSQLNLFRDLQSATDKYTKPKDKIFIFSDEPMLYLILNRDNATKYVLPYAANLKSMRENMLMDLKSNKPVLILVDKNAWPVDGINNFIRLPEVVKYIYSNYQTVKTIDGVQFLRIN